MVHICQKSEDNWNSLYYEWKWNIYKSVNYMKDFHYPCNQSFLDYNMIMLNQKSCHLMEIIGKYILFVLYR